MKECLWCNELRTAGGKYFCDKTCAKKASRVVRMSLGVRKSKGKSGIQAILLGLLVKTLNQYSDGLILKDLVSFTHKEYSDYGKLLNAAKLSHYFRIFLRSDVYTRQTNRSGGVYTYKIVKGSCLKDWLKPQYVEHLESF
jgi:hypothetical protein